MDDAPYTQDLDLASVTTYEELMALLRTVHLRADRPSLRTLEARTRHEATPLSKTVLSEMLKGVRFPRKAVMVAFLRACGVQDDQIEPWRHAWERIAAREPQGMTAHDASVGRNRPTAFPVAAETPDIVRLREQIDELNADNARLRLQLAAIDQQRISEEPHVEDAARARTLHSPIASQRELGILLRNLRQAKGMTVEQVAEHLMCSPSKVNHMEASSRAGTLRDVRDLCDLYGVTDQAERDRMLSLAREGKKTGWWQGYHLADFAKYVGLEAGAVGIKSYQSALVPGLMQTSDYARAIHEAVIPKLTSEMIEQFVEVRMTRQRLLLQEPAVCFEALLDEAVFHRPVGDTAVMRAQLERLVELSSKPNITMLVIPYSAGAHPAMGSIFNVLEFAGSVPSLVYVEGLVGWIYLERPQDVARYHHVFEHLRTMALNQQDSTDLIARISAGY